MLLIETSQMCKQLHLIYALLSRNQICRDLRAFWGALFAKIWWEGAQKHFNGPGISDSHIWVCIRQELPLGIKLKLWEYVDLCFRICEPSFSL